jgi:hypothetical protein
MVRRHARDRPGFDVRCNGPVLLVQPLLPRTVR